MSDVELCDHCGVTLHAPEHDIEREDTAGHECVPMLRKEIEHLQGVIDLAYTHAMNADQPSLVGLLAGARSTYTKESKR